MDKLLAYIKGLPLAEREHFAARCGTTLGYLRKACSIKQKLNEMVCLRISSESGHLVTPEDLRPDVDWALVRDVLKSTEATAQEA